MIFCNGGPHGTIKPVSVTEGNIDQLFSWQPWHSKQLDSHNWVNAVCDKLELGPVMSCVQARCFKPLKFHRCNCNRHEQLRSRKNNGRLESKRL